MSQYNSGQHSSVANISTTKSLGPLAKIWARRGDGYEGGLDHHGVIGGMMGWRSGPHRVTPRTMED